MAKRRGGGGPQILLEAEKPKVENGNFSVAVVVAVGESNGTIKAGHPVSFFMNTRRVAAGNTGADGSIQYVFQIPFSESGKEIELKARADGFVKKAVKKITLPEAPVPEKGMPEAAKDNVMSRKTAIISDVVKAVVFAVIALVLLNYCNSVGALGLLLGLIALFKIGKLSVMGIIAGLLSGAAVAFVTWTWPSLVIGPLNFGVIWAVILGAPFYLLEEAWSPTNEDGSRGKPKWNCYPWWPILIIGLPLAAWNFIEFLGAVSSPFEFIRDSMGGGGVSLNGGASGINLNGGLSAGIARGFGGDLTDTIDWIAFIFVLSAYAIPGEIFGMFSGKVGGKLEHTFLLGELFVIGKSLFGKKKGGKK